MSWNWRWASLAGVPIAVAVWFVAAPAAQRSLRSASSPAALELEESAPSEPGPSEPAPFELGSRRGPRAVRPVLEQQPEADPGGTLELARRARRTGDPSSALELVQSASEPPEVQAELDWIGIQAWVDLGEISRARAAAKDFYLTYPDHSRTSDVHRLTGKHLPPRGPGTHSVP